MSHDVVGHPSKVGIAQRRAQLERDRLRLLDQLEREQLIDVSALAPRGRIRIPLVRGFDEQSRKL